MGGPQRREWGATVENEIETSDYKAVHHNEAPMVQNPLHGVESLRMSSTNNFLSNMNPLHGVES
jgi:hypothetical protein